MTIAWIVFGVVFLLFAVGLTFIEWLEWRDAQQVEPWRRVAMREHPESEEGNDHIS